jgi:asparagine synthase (glutamine-hydrolysing)
MCGIAGIWNFNRPINRETLERFTLSVHHRGPDAHDVWIDAEHGNPDLGLGHTRLSILDLSPAGKCPMKMVMPNGEELYITFNGEVYNFLELRSELEAQGYRFTNQTDTQVILAAYHCWGSDALKRFNGMWALAIWNPKKRELFLSRDRFGVKPLFFSVTDRLAFASEIKAFCSLDGFTPTLEQEVLPQLVSGNSSEGNVSKTLIKDVYRLLPGHSAVVSQEGDIRMNRWWETRDNLPTPENKYEDQVEAFRDLFLDAVRIRMRSDVPVGTLLSGGIDSTAVASTMAFLHKKGSLGDRVQSDWQRTCIATFPGTIIDESYFANLVVSHIGAKASYWEFTDAAVLPHVLDSVWAMEEVAHSIATPVWCTYRKLRETGVTVSIDGHGSDELLGGYSGYLDWPMKTFNNGLYDDFHRNLLPAILRNFDRCSAAHGIEVRMPFMDYRLVSYAFSLDATAKVGAGFTKRIIRDAMQGIMPDEIRSRRSKIGFNSPMIEWFNGGLKKFLHTMVHRDSFISQRCFDPKKYQEIVRIKASSGWTKEDWGLTLDIWSKINLALLEEMLVRGKRPTELYSELF